jgi:hypothetical protein
MKPAFFFLIKKKIHNSSLFKGKKTRFLQHQLPPKKKGGKFGDFEHTILT